MGLGCSDLQMATITRVSSKTTKYMAEVIFY